MATKKTISEQFTEVINFLIDNGAKEGHIDFLKDRKAIHEKKIGSRKPTKEQEENAVLRNKILDVMENDKQYTISDLQKLIGIDSNQKVSALVRQLKENHLVNRSEVKGKAYFNKI